MTSSLMGAQKAETTSADRNTHPFANMADPMEKSNASLRRRRLSLPWATSAFGGQRS
jgi:hypothetical protein